MVEKEKLPGKKTIGKCPGNGHIQKRALKRSTYGDGHVGDRKIDFNKIIRSISYVL